MNSRIATVLFRVASACALALLSVDVVRADITGFNSGTNWQLNTGGFGGTAPAISGQQLTVSTVNSSANNSAFYKTQQSDNAFTANFTYTDAANSTRGGDGATFVIQNDPRGTAATSSSDGGGGLGYGGGSDQITKSVAIELHIDSLFSPPIGVGLGIDGTVGTYTTPGSVSLYGGHPINVRLTYNGTVLNESLTDTVSGATYATSYTVNIPSIVGGSSAYVGFTGGAGLDTSTEVFSNFTYASTVGTPEPASWILAAFGGLGLWVVARRRSRARLVA